MTVYVDPIQAWPTKIRCFQAGSCHLTTDDVTLEELHAFASRIGMRRAWFQPHPIAPHYDLTVAKRVLAVELGSVEVSSRLMIQIQRARRAKSV